MKQVLEGQVPTRKTQQHLDRCLTCRNCESTCRSGVQYGHLLDIGRKIVDVKVPRPAPETALRWALKEGLPSPRPRHMKMGQPCAGCCRGPAGQGPGKHRAGACPRATIPARC